ncbi:ATPase, AAA family protein [Cardiosporidium cionae]|uniref:ATPase, AAA family protein n=1 Tax=Cardiosporidium cionae TaxID=476202 RepID=A0ABQ7J956_9APIC|nr:ATPase, AAA family protein [Cardiosporidium cionae]|eukprot:KAF8820517.1 ATPase, AAA family protein [Cardiosporidium cionae]
MDSKKSYAELLYLLLSGCDNTDIPEAEHQKYVTTNSRAYDDLFNWKLLAVTGLKSACWNSVENMNENVAMNQSNLYSYLLDYECQLWCNNERNIYPPTIPDKELANMMSCCGESLQTKSESFSSLLEAASTFLDDSALPLGANPPEWNRYITWIPMFSKSSHLERKDTACQSEGLADSLVYSTLSKVHSGEICGSASSTQTAVSHAVIPHNPSAKVHQENTGDSNSFLTGFDLLKKRKVMGNPEAIRALQETENSKGDNVKGTFRSKPSSNFTSLKPEEPKSSTGQNVMRDDSMQAYKEILEGEIREEILASVLSMRLSPSQLTVENDIAGLAKVKKLMRDKLINPILRPELHVGLHQAPKGILLFGPPGTGKTTLAKWMATASGATFFEVTPSSIISKYHGETETLIRTLFKVAEVHSPSIIFIDEIDSLLGKRRDKEDDSTIRMKNQLLQMMDGVSSDSNKMVVLIGATNRPDMLDEAALRRLSKRVLIPLPDLEARQQQIRSICTKSAEYSYDETIEKYDGIENVPSRGSFRPISFHDFVNAFSEVHPSSNISSLDFQDWALQFGTL